METLQSKLKTLGITESNSNHILENNSHSVKACKNENCKHENSNGEREEKKIENGHMDQCEELVMNGSQSPCIKSASNQTSTENEESTELSEISHHHHPVEVNPSPKCPELEIVEVLRDLPDKTTETFQLTYKVYESELELPSIMKLIQKDLSEPYSIYTYRYFIHNWGHLCYLALHENKCVGCIVCKLDIHRQMIKRGYIAMLAVDKDYRKLKIGTTLVQKAIRVSVTLCLSKHDCYKLIFDFRS